MSNEKGQQHLSERSTEGEGPPTGPPNYSESTQPEGVALDTRRRYGSIIGITSVDFTQYRIPGATISKDETTVTVPLTEVGSDSRALQSFVLKQAALPPKPQLRITGSHKTWQEEVVDFDIHLNLLRQITRPQSATWNYVKVSIGNESSSSGGSGKRPASQTQDGLGDWVNKFCRDPASNKT